MSLYAIADLHLSLGTDKPMDVFRGWQNYKERIESNWRSLVKEDDTVVVVGDISWAMKLEECYADFCFINSLPGKKIFVKGNHDYWWTTKRKMDDYLETNGFDTIKILFNNSFEYNDIAICGSRGWYYDAESADDIKVLNREVGRLKLSLDSVCDKSKRRIVFLHYPPVYNDIECSEIFDVLSEYGITDCYYGHLHGKNTHRYAVNGAYKNVKLQLVSCDYLDFMPLLVR